MFPAAILMVTFCWIEKVTSSAKNYYLQSGQQIVNIPDEFDETLLQDVKGHPTETALTKGPLTTPQASPLQRPSPPASQ